MVCLLVAIGVGWGATQPLGKIATMTGHQPFGLIFWQLVICTAILGALTLARGRRLALTPAALRFYLVVALLGTLIPNFTFYLSAARLPSGIMSIIISTIPLIAFPIALMLGMDRFSWRRLAGLGLGLTGVLLIVVPKAGLPDPAMVAYLPVAMVGPLFYALENTFVARNGMAGMDAVQAMFGASLAGLILSVPLVLVSGQGFMMPLPPGPAEWALILSSAAHALLYASFIWLAARAGSVFAAQSSYITTAAGVVWAMLLLGERFSPWLWAAVAVLLAGVSLVQPRPRAAQ